MLRRLYDWMMAKATHPHAAGWLAVFSFMESSFFPIPPHPMLGLMCLAEPQKAVRFAIITTLASVIGGLFGYAIGYFLYDSVGTTLLSWLGLTESFPQAACALREYGAEIILIKGATPIPFKLITITSGFIHLDLFTFIWASVASRALQFMAVGVLFRVFGAPIKAVIDKYLGWVTAAFLILLVGGFIAASMLSEGGHVSDACSASPVVAVP